MSRIGELLAQRRRLSCAGSDTTHIDAQIRDAQARSRGTERQTRQARSPVLFFSGHARRRMAQRGINAREVYAVWLYGERRRLQNRRIAHVATDDAISCAPDREKAIMKRRAGMAVLVDPPPKHGLRPVLVSVLADGRDTYFS